MVTFIYLFGGLIGMFFFAAILSLIEWILRG